MSDGPLPTKSCRDCKYSNKSVGADPCLECISKWTEEPASKYEKLEDSENDQTTL